jgi:hypothetical protein
MPGIDTSKVKCHVLHMLLMHCCLSRLTPTVGSYRGSSVLSKEVSKH